jgi:hypothetical protein
VRVSGRLFLHLTAGAEARVLEDVLGIGGLPLEALDLERIDALEAKCPR